MSNWVMFPEYRHDKPIRNVLINLDEAKHMGEPDNMQHVTRISFNDSSSVVVSVTVEDVSLFLGGQRIGC